MPNKKVKISNILNSQIPDFILDDGSLFKEFLEQYYASEEHEYGTTYLADNLESIKKITTLSDIATVEAQTVIAPGTTAPSSPVVVAAEAYAYDDVIYVNQTTGFPDKWGLLKINDEIITYTGKTATSFTGCKRGFSGISAIETAGSPEYLTFSETNSTLHDAGTLVVNLSFLFLVEFYKKHKYQFLPGLEGRSFKQGIALENILSRAKDFYSSKGTDTALEILFQALYGEQVEIVKPFDETLMPSEAEWSVTDDMVVETISGDPLKLIGSKIYQDSTANPTASGAVANVQQVFLNNKRYYQIKFSRGSVNSTFKVGGKTKVVGTASTVSVTTVDSTVGFSTVGNFYYLNADNVYTAATYTSKSSNQFFGCVGISTVLKESDPIIDETFIYGYEDNDLTKLCQMRVTGSISGASEANTKFFANEDAITVKHLGEKVDPNNPKFESWFYNNLSYVDVEENISNNTFKTKEKHFLKNGDIVDVLYQDTYGIAVSEDIVSDVVGDNQFKISNNTVDVNKNYVIRKKINYVDSNYGIPSLLSNIQNTFVDDSKNTYVAFSGYPSFSASSTNRSKTFTSSGVSTNTSIITFVDDHNFYNGEKIYVGIGTEGVVDGTNTIFTSGYYYVSVVNVKDIQLCVNLPNLHVGINESIKFNGEAASGIHTVTPASLYKNGSLKNQDNFKRILKTPELVDNNSDISGPIGVSLNGVELHSPISEDSVYYGPLTDVDILNEGQNYDVINPPNVSIADTYGSGAVINANFSGSISDIVLTSRGFDYRETPSVSIVGGNGSGAICEAKMRGYTHSETFTDFNVQLVDPGRIDRSHKFLDGEEVTYIASGTPIGIGNTQVGFATDRLASGTTYYIAKHSTTSFGLAISKSDALNKINLIHFNQFGNKSHEFRSRKIRNIIDRIVINDSGKSYSNKKITVQSQVYPPINAKDLFKTYVGINTFDNYVYARNHNFNNKDIVSYSSSNTVIGGLSAGDYYVTLIDENRFKLSSNETNYDRNIFVDLNSIGVGTHTFKYPDIAVNIGGEVGIGTTTSIESYYNADAYAEVRGGIGNIFVESGGSTYGVDNTINFLRRPKITLLTGKDAILNPIVDSTGKIGAVAILNKGSEYTTPPELRVTEVGASSGQFAKLRAVISNGEIVDVDILDPGINYNSTDTVITVVPAGESAKFSANVYEWKLNSVSQYSNILSDSTYRDIIQVGTGSILKGNKICSFYPGNYYRKLLDDHIEDISGVLKEKTPTSHSKIIGWAYDGNPIYGPVGEVGIGLTYMQSSYDIDSISDSGLRPAQSKYSPGSFVQDYVYNSSGDLDEYNGKFVKTPEYPNGIYAYFSTIDKTLTPNTVPTFPYITKQHRNKTDLFNYDVLMNQSDNFLNSGKYKRNVTHLGLNDPFRTYPLLSDSLDSNAEIRVDSLNSGKVSKIIVNDGGESYKSGELIGFNNKSISASIDEVYGKNIISVETSDTIIDDLKFSVVDGKVTGLSTLPHGLTDKDIIEISGITSSLYTNIEGFRTIGVSSVTSGLTSSMVNSGVTTFIALHDSTLSKKFDINDVVQVESEQLQVIAHDDYNNRYRVTRGYNGTTASGHGSGAIVYRLETEFTYDVPEKLENKNIEFPKIQYFEGVKSVGLGSVYTDVVVGYAGSVAIKKSIPPRSIYLPNHKFKTGDVLSFVSIGSTVFVSGTDALTPAVDLSTYGNLYCVKLSDEFIGVSTQKANYTTTHSWFTVVQSSGGDNNSLEVVTDNVNGRLKKVSATVTTDSNHSLTVDDNVRLDISPNKAQTIDLRFNSDIRKLVTNPVTIASTGIGTITDEITIANHDFNTGDIVVYNSSTPATPLVDDGVYHVIDESDNTIRLAETKYDVNLFPYSYIGIGTTGGDPHTFTKINPRIELYQGNTAEFLVSDTSLDGYNIAFYSDENFKTRYDSGLISRTGVIGDGLTAKISVSLGSSISDKLYYRVEGKELNYTKTYPSAAQSDVIRSSELEIVNSKFNKIHRVTGVANTTFTFNMVGSGETTLYNNLGFTSAFYATDSSSTMGGVYSIKIVSAGEKVNKLPIITSIGTTTGKNALFTVESLDIGKVDDTVVHKQGLEFSRDKTIQPKADSNIILELKDVFTLKSIGVTTGGTNYTSSPVTIAIGKPSVVTRTNLVGNAVDSVDILSNESGLSDSLRIIPTVNSNGIQVTSATTSSTQIVTLGLRGPVNGFDANNPFPFAVGDKVFVENVKVTESDVDGYNSSDYDYKYFTLTGINTTGGTESVAYSIAGIGSTGGTYNSGVSNFGRVVNVEDLASYSPTFEKTSFFENETVRVPNKNIFGYVAKNGWDPEAQTLKLYNVTGEFGENDTIVGDISNNKAGIGAIFSFDFNLDVDSTVENVNEWKDDVGKLNLDIQRIHDNDYYQRFSYAIKGENIPYLTWKDPINSLSHTSGFRGFSNLGITSTGALSTKSDSQLDLSVTLSSEASVWERWYYDDVTEETDDSSLSKIVKFENRIITKYNESRTNKVLLIDDISSQFNGITTSVGGGIIGLSTFAAYTTGDRLFYKDFNPATGIDTSTYEINIPRHEFNTGERLRYTPHTGSIGIGTTTVPGVGSTNIMPTDVYVIKITDDKFKVAVARSFASAGAAVTFTTVTGIGTIHNLQVPTEDASIRSVITVDNVIQSPIAITTAISVNLTGPVGINTNFVYLNSVADISGKSLININQEILKVSLVGVGSARELDILRAQMGTVAAAHTVGAAVTVIKGDYKVENGNIYFADAPYGPAGIGSLTSQSTFAGRSYYRLDYTSNKIMDDISDRFDGATDKFDLTTNGAEMSGITSSFGMVLVNNIFQRPDVDELSGESSSDYSLVGTGKTIDFTGTSANKDLPKGGIINEFDVGIGSGYQLPRQALLDVVINSNTGTISTVGILTGGSGYLSAPMVSIASTDRHFSHSFVSAANNAVNGSLTPTNAEYTSSTGMMVLTIPGHTLTTSNTVQFTNNSITMSCSRDNYTTNHTYPRTTDPVAGVATAILATSANTVTVFVGLGSGTDAVLTTHITDGSVSWVNITKAGTGYTSTGIGGSTGFAVVDIPKPYKNIALSGGSGSGAAVDVVVGTGGSIVDFKLSNRGMGYEIGEQLEIINLPFQAGIATSRFNVTIRNKYQDKFAGWCFGELIELDDFSNLFNGYRKSFLITRTGAAGKEYYSVVAKDGSGIILANNLFLFLNDILQIPDRDYEFSGGTRISFKEAPKTGSKFKFYLYAGSELDYAEVDVDESVKPGDELKLQAGINSITDGRISEQDNRIIYELIAADTVETQTYSGIGIVTDPAARRPTMWRKQTNDMLIDGVKISKERNYLEPQIYPTTGIIKSVSNTDGTIWVEDSWLYDHVDELDQDINNVRIVGLGTTAVSEVIEKVSYNGDYGTIVGIGTSAVGIGTTTSPALYFDLKVASEIFADVPNDNQLKIPGIGTGGYFTIKGTHIGPGVTGIVTHTSEVVSVGNTFLDNVYYAATVVGMGATTLRVFANITSLSGIDTSIISDVVTCGSYSWGSLSGSRDFSAKSYTFHNQNGLIGIQTSAQVIRDVQLKVKYT